MSFNEHRGFRALLGEPRWSHLMEQGSMRSYAPRSTLLRNGDAGGYLFILLSGRVSVLGHDEDGDQLLVSLRGPGDLVGELARISGMRTASVQAIDRCTVRALPGPMFENFLRRENAYERFAAYLAAKLGETISYKLLLAHFTPRRKLARLLLDLVELADPVRPDHAAVPFSQESLATALGLARSTVAEQILVMRRGGALSPSRKLVVADVDRLRGYAEA